MCDGIPPWYEKQVCWVFFLPIRNQKMASIARQISYFRTIWENEKKIICFRRWLPPQGKFNLGLNGKII